MSQVSVASAAKLVGKDRKTLYRLIKDGKLSATTSDSGLRQVETSELLRVFGAFKESTDSRDSGATVSMSQVETPRETSEGPNIELLRVELRHARELAAAKDEQIQDLRTTIRLLEFKSKKSWWKF